MSEFLNSLAASPIGVWVGESSGYPLLLVLHSIGLALLVGMLVVIDLCVLGLGAPAMPPGALRNIMRISWSGLLLAVLSGSLLFVVDGNKYYYSFTFRLKLTCIVLGAWLAIALSRHLRQSPVRSAGAAVRIAAAASLLCWLGAIMSGRLMAYVN